jgi:hypothetical protein
MGSIGFRLALGLNCQFRPTLWLVYRANVRICNNRCCHRKWLSRQAFTGSIWSSTHFFVAISNHGNYPTILGHSSHNTHIIKPPNQAFHILPHQRSTPPSGSLDRQLETREGDLQGGICWRVIILKLLEKTGFEGWGYLLRWRTSREERSAIFTMGDAHKMSMYIGLIIRLIPAVFNYSGISGDKDRSTALYAHVADIGVGVLP